MTGKLKLLAASSLLVLLLAGCGESKGLKSELSEVKLSRDLPSVRMTECRYLEQADDEVYEQQLAACEMYYEAYELTKGSDYAKKYSPKIKKKKVNYYCFERRKALNLEIATELNDNVNEMIYSVEDCDNISAYLKRVNEDTLNFFDYYIAYENAGSDIKPACDILTAFYERSNVLAFRFMEDNKDDIISCAVEQIIKNSMATEDMHKYIANNNELVKAMNTVYGGVPSEYVSLITAAEIRLVRRMLEEANELSAIEINSLMSQLGEPTPEPETTPTPEPEEDETEPTSEPVPRRTADPEDDEPVRTAAPVRTQQPEVQRPIRTQAPVATRAPLPTSVPRQEVQEPAVVPAQEQSTPEVYIFGE